MWKICTQSISFLSRLDAWLWYHQAKSCCPFSCFNSYRRGGNGPLFLSGFLILEIYDSTVTLPFFNVTHIHTHTSTHTHTHKVQDTQLQSKMRQTVSYILFAACSSSSFHIIRRVLPASSHCSFPCAVWWDIILYRKLTYMITFCHMWPNIYSLTNGVCPGLSRSYY